MIKSKEYSFHSEKECVVGFLLFNLQRGVKKLRASCMKKYSLFFLRESNFCMRLGTYSNNINKVKQKSFFFYNDLEQ